MPPVPLKAAVARFEITPPEKTELIPFDAKAEWIQSPLYARLLLLEQAPRRCLIVSLDAIWATERTVKVRSLDGKGVRELPHALASHELRIVSKEYPLDTERFPEAKIPLRISGIAIGEMVLLSYSGEMFNQYGPS